MAFNPYTIIKSLLIRKEGVTNPTEVEIVPNGASATKTTIVATQTSSVTVSLPDATDTLVGKATTDTLTNKTIDADDNSIVVDAAGVTATDLNDALAEIQSNVDGSDAALLAHINDTTGAHAASAISVTPSGNLAATDAQGALVELQTDVDTRATSAALTAHTGASTGVHGVTGNVVGTTDTQTLTNKTLTAPVINSPTGIVKADVGLGNVDNTSDATKNAAAVTLTNKTIDNTNTITVKDANLTVQDDVDPTKQVKLQVSSVTAGQTRTLTVPDASTTIVGTDAVQALTNKDIDGGTASNASRLTLPKAAKTTLDALTRKQGTIVMDTTTNKPYYDDGTNLQPFGSGAGNVNLISNPDGEAGTTGWTLYTNTPGPRPVTGAGGAAPTFLSFTTTATNPLAGTNSFLLSKAAVSTQGQGVSRDEPLPLQYRAKALTATIPYIVESGTFVAGSSTTDSDVILYFYDITNSKLVEPSSFKFLSNSSTVSDAIRATVQFDSNCTSFRTILHVASTSGVAYALKLDNISVSPSNYQYGTPVTDWISYTPAWLTNSTNPVLGNGSLVGKWRRVGDNAEVRIDLIMGGTTTFGSGNYYFSLPPGLSIDTTKATIGGGAGVSVFGEGRASQGSSSDQNGVVVCTNVLGANYISIKANASASLYGNTVPFAFASGNQINLLASMPIVGFSSSVQTSDQTDTRIVDFVSYVGVSTALTANVTNIPLVSRKDTHGAFNGNTLYTIPVAGDYDISVIAAPNSAVNMNIQIYLNSSPNNIFPASVSGAYGGGSTTLPNLKAGDMITFRSLQSLTILGDTVSSIVIKRISGPSVIAANDLISLKYTSTSGQAMINNVDTVVAWNTKVFDTHNAMNTSTGEFTAPAAGVYNIHSSLLGTKATTATMYLVTRVDGVIVQSDYTTIIGDASARITDSLYLRAGQKLTIGFYHNFGSTFNLYTTATYNWVTITREGK